jgi:hypothetical protein
MFGLSNGLASTRRRLMRKPLTARSTFMLSLYVLCEIQNASGLLGFHPTPYHFFWKKWTKSAHSSLSLLLSGRKDREKHKDKVTAQGLCFSHRPYQDKSHLLLIL